MIKYVDTLIGFIEIPDEISLCINISNCPNNCEGCHSSYLKDDIGTPLTYVELKNLIDSNKGITCICFMGGDAEPWEIIRLAKLVKEEYNLKVGWYSGKDEFFKGNDFLNFDYIKIGSYNKERGPLNNKNTNQRMYQLYHTSDGCVKFVNITNKFWKQHGNED